MVTDGQWGSKEADGSWNGLVGELQRKVQNETPDGWLVTCDLRERMSRCTIKVACGRFKVTCDFSSCNRMTYSIYTLYTLFET